MLARRLQQQGCVLFQQHTRRSLISCTLQWTQQQQQARCISGIMVRNNVLSSSYSSSSFAPLRLLSSSTVNRSGDVHEQDFVSRHIGPSDSEVAAMLDTLGLKDVDALVNKVIDERVPRRAKPMSVRPQQSERQVLQNLENCMAHNVVARSHIGAGYYNTITPGVIERNVLQNPLWYTAYTPYQAEISQGRMQMLLNFQTMTSDLTGLPMSCASLLDEATAAAEAMYMCFNAMPKKNPRHTFLISSDCHPQTIAVCRTRALGFGIDVKVVHHSAFELTDDVFGVLVQYPATNGLVTDFEKLTTAVHEIGGKVVCATDLLALTVLKPPGEWGCDIAVGSSQRFGVPMGFGGPHAAFLTTTEQFTRMMPGRIIGVSKDARGFPALRMALATREQFIRRERASSNICTAQALLANVAASYAVYHGPERITQIATNVHTMATTFALGVTRMGLTVKCDAFFDTVHVDLNGADNAQMYVDTAEQRGINLRCINKNNLYVSFDETTIVAHVQDLFDVFAAVNGEELKAAALLEEVLAGDIAMFGATGNHALRRETPILTHEVFSLHNDETSMLRYLHSLAKKDYSLADGMIPLGSCTMKLNATSEMVPISWNTVANIHPFAPASQTAGYVAMIRNLGEELSDITGFDSMTFQPNSGASGEYAGLCTIAAYHRANGQSQRNICVIPTSAHGTNPASAAMAGMKIVSVKCDEKGNTDMEDLKRVLDEAGDELSCVMITYPSTHGVFEPTIKDLCDQVHAAGGQVYMDGANMNAQTGITSPGDLGADVCHLNLHKTFCIPHGGGGPGMGPIGVAKHLTPFLPTHPYDPFEVSSSATGAISAAPFSSASILPITWMYLGMMGPEGLKRASEIAMLNANYMAKKLSGHYDVLFTNGNGYCAHEFILDLRPLTKRSKVTEKDVAKRLIDYGIHAPTMSWPVGGTLMIEPTESEPVHEMDRVVAAMISIRAEIEKIATGEWPVDDNPLKNAPHTADQIATSEWNHPYTREEAVFPTTASKFNKFWPSVARLDDAYGDKNLVCSCPPLDFFLEQQKEQPKKRVSKK